MSNLATVTIQPDDEYQDLAELAGITFTEGKKYTLQVEGDVRLCEKDTKPTSGGFHIMSSEPFEYEAGSDTLWVKNLKQKTLYPADVDAIINIAD